MKDLVLGIDIGSQGTCAQLLDASGELLAVAYEGYDVRYPRPGWAEQDPRAWLAALGRTVAEATAGVDRSRIAALSFGAQLDGLVCVDGAGEPLRDAIIWMDRRGDEVCGALAERVDPDAAVRDRAGCNLDGGHVGAKIAWIREHEPGPVPPHGAVPPARLVRGAARVRRATASTPRTPPARCWSTSARRDWDDGICAAFGIDPAALAPVVPPHGVLEHDRAVAARGDRACPPRRWSCAAAATRWQPRSAPASSTRAPSAT